MDARHERIRRSLPYQTTNGAVVLRHRPENSRNGKIRYTGIGVSTGGPDAIKRLLADIPHDIHGTILIAMHMPPNSTELLATNLSRATKLKVSEAKDGQIAEPGTVLIAPGGKQMRLKKCDDGKDRISIENSEEKELCRPSVNILFKSLAAVEPTNSAAVIMTGMGEDGYLGMQELASRGAYLMAQRADDCLIYGMPKKPIEAGLISEILNVHDLASKLTTLMR